MPRRPRIDLAGYHHVINRGVNRSDIFVGESDYAVFLGIVCKACKAYAVVLHDYCLMSNHFHLLVETHRENLSLFMKHINSNYAIYANKKQKRSGHFWQGRFYSRYINSESYYYTLIRYIEQNPIEAGLATTVGEYPYTLASCIANRQTPPPCTLDSKLLLELDYENIQEMIGVALGDEELEILTKIQKQKVLTHDNTKTIAYSKTLKEHFRRKDRNSAIGIALQDGYTQASIAKHLGISRSLVSKIVKKNGVFSTPDPFKEDFDTIDRLGKSRTPFLFIVSYNKTKIFAQALQDLDDDIYYKLEDWRNYPVKKRDKAFTFSKSPVDFYTYKKALDNILEEIRSGNTYLINLTFQTPIETNFSLKEIFTYAKAKFKLYYKNEFICFSPERFVQIEDDTIATYPMKGTIDANIPYAQEKILADEKEMAEHVMIVDLMRNDLGIVGSNVKVEKFRYVEKIQAGDKELLQVSSKITATLPPNWKDTIGTLLSQLLPAGSITGTPKQSTINIIDNVENFDRGFYTGVFGLFDGKSLRSGVMIRFIEKENHALFYKSGGGITIDSDAKSEYNELVDKIYLPF
ncbi:MAG: Para-aminobenzoate synthase, aminase component (EC [uncultured Sulfurovum sp.]|uniref:Para-aminobenzoate synthase, aminase component (EC) n=1 Tax=uncultured Sulfurovum sp. TaxID=269237 RepID=A0A6S6TNV3_9BACT|nr:MAG: Para-aminobenzoate synthase, aminase component (EC [uncultured Sulfurovum sp.]